MTFPENHAGATMRLLAWVIMDHDAEHLTGKSNVFRVPQFTSQDWQTIISLGVYTIKEMQNSEESQSSKQVATMTKGRK